MSAKTAYRSGLTASLAILLFGVLGLVNYLSARFFFHRFDLTSNQQYTVSEPTKKLLRSLDDVVNIKVYFSRNLPEQAATIPARVRDLLRELEVHARGMLRVENIDPLADPEEEQKVRSMGIPRVPMTVLERNKQDTREVYLGMAILHGDQKQVIPAVLDDANLEYDIVSRVVKLTQPRKTVGFLTGHGEHDTFGDLRTAAEALRQQYDVESVDLDKGNPVPDTVSSLVVAGPRQPVSERAGYAIDQFLMRGGSVLFLIDAFEVDPRSMMVRPLETQLGDQIASYGVRVKPALIADWGMNEMVQVPGGGEFGGMPTFYISEYPLWPKLLGDNLAQDHPVTSGLQGMVMPWAAPLEIVKDATSAFTVTELAHSTQFSHLEDKLFSANPRTLTEPRQEDLKRYLMAAAVTGPQKSFFSGKPVPAPRAEEPKEGEIAPTAPEPADRRDETASAQIVVISSSQFATDSLVGRRGPTPNLVLFLNAVDWLTMGGELSSIRSRMGGDPLLDPGRRKAGEPIVPWLNIVLIPLLVVVIGILWRQARKSRRFAMA